MILLKLLKRWNITLIPKYRIVVTLSQALLLKFFKIRVIANGNQIYQLEKDRSVTIPFTTNRPIIVVTDGFHYTKPLEIAYHHKHTYFLTVVCAIDDNRLAAGAILTALFYAIGFTSDIALIRFMSFIPLIYFVYLYYINRKNFIQIKAGHSS